MNISLVSPYMLKGGGMEFASGAWEDGRATRQEKEMPAMIFLPLRKTMQF